MSEKTEKLDTEAKTYVTKTDKAALEAIARQRGKGVKVTDLLREKIDELIRENFPKGFRESAVLTEDASPYRVKKKK